MGNCCQKENFQNYFPSDQVVIKEKDRRIKVNPIQFESFPYNSIGWIQSKQTSNGPAQLNIKNQRSLLVDATGFLISSTLVLTSCHNFVIRDEEKGQLKQFTPVSFTVMEPGKSGEKKLVQRCVKIGRVKLNMKYFAILNQIVLLKNLFNNQKGKSLKLQYANNILKLQSEAIQHDFSLLKLERPIERSQYFRLCTNFTDKPLLAVTGFQNFYGSQFRLLTHSNVLDSINDKGIFYDIDTSSGQSGAPVYIISQKKKSIVKLVGIQKAYWPRKRMSFATMITQQVVTVLKEWAKQLRSSFDLIDGNAMPQITNEQEQYQQKQQQKQQQQRKPLLPPPPPPPKIIESLGTSADAPEYNEKGNQYFQKGQLKQAFECYSKALNILQRDQKNKDSIEYANTLKNIGNVYEEQLVYNEALQFYTRAHKIYEKDNKDSSLCAQTLNDIGNTYRKRGKLGQALINYEKSLKIYDKGKDKASQSCANTLSNIGWVYDHQARYVKSLESYNRALTIYERANGKDSVNSAVTLNNIGVVYKQLQKPKDALQYYNKALRIYERIKEKETMNCANTLHNIGAAYDDLKKYNESLGFYNRSLSIKERLNGKDSFECAQTLYNLGLVYQKIGDKQKANQLFEQSTKIKNAYQ